MKKFFLFFILVAIVIIVSFLAFFKKTAVTPSNSTISITTNIPPVVHNSTPYYDDEIPMLDDSTTLDDFLNLEDLFLVNHPILSNTPLLLTTVTNLIKDLDFSTQNFESSGANNFIYTLFSSPDISYVSVGSSLDMNKPPTYFIVTSDKYQLVSGLRVGLSKEEALTLYKSNSACESFQWDNTMLDILGNIISYDETYCFYGTVTSAESKKYNMESYHLAPSGLYLFLEDEKVVAFSNVLPGAN